MTSLGKCPNCGTLCSVTAVARQTVTYRFSSSGLYKGMAVEDSLNESDDAKIVCSACQEEREDLTWWAGRLWRKER